MKKKLLKSLAGIFAIGLLLAPVTVSLASPKTECPSLPGRCPGTISYQTSYGYCSHKEYAGVYKCSYGHIFAACSQGYH